MILSKQLFQDRFLVPKNWREVQTYRLFEECGFVEFPYSGFPLFLPIGKRIMDNICSIIREEAEKRGFSELYIPLVQDKRFLESTGRAEIFEKEFMELKGRMEGFILAPTNEEIFLDLATRGLSSYRQLPIRLYQIAEKFRNILKAKGILRSRQFLMCDMISLDEDELSLRESSLLFEEIVDSIFNRMNLSPIRVEKNNGRYVDYLIPCQEGETIICKRGKRADYDKRKTEDNLTASSVAMYFIFENIGTSNPTYQANDGSRKEVFLGTYGLGIQRIFHAAVEVYKDAFGINFPSSIRPFDVSIIVLDPNDVIQMEMGRRCYDYLLNNGMDVILDDRNRKSLKNKTELSDFYGIPKKVVIGKVESRSNILTIKNRGNVTGETINFNLDSLGCALNE